MNKFIEILDVDELKTRKRQSRALLAVKGGATLHINSIGVYIIGQIGEEEYWTFNETQAVEKWNAIKNVW